MNSTNLVGRITKDLELRATPNGKYVCEFSLAVNRFKEGVDFITCQVWGTQAENLAKYQGKGSQVAVMGSLRVDTFDDKDGNRRYKTYVLANSIEYLESKQATQKEAQADSFADFGNSTQEATQKVQTDSFTDYGNSTDDNWLE